MKENYEVPVVEIVEINAADVIFASDGGCTGCNTENG